MLVAWRKDYNWAHPHSTLANRMQAVFCDHHLALAATNDRIQK
jgi:hypothetical protein